MTEAQNKAEELREVFGEYIQYVNKWTYHKAIYHVKGIIEELEKAMDNSDQSWTYTVNGIRLDPFENPQHKIGSIIWEQVNEWRAVLKELGG